MSEYTKQDIGCYFGSAFGFDHNTLRVLDLAKQHGFNDWSSRLEQAAYSPNGIKGDDFDEWVLTIDRAMDYLNDNTTRPDNTYWMCEDGDFGLWEYCEEHFDLPISSGGPCIVCGNKGDDN